MESIGEITTRRDEARYALGGLMAVQGFVGYEWFMSGLAKLWRGGFANGLDAELREKSEGVTGWYRRLLDNTIIPHAWFVGWVVLIAELAIGVALVAAALTSIWWSGRLSRSSRRLVLGMTAAAALGATVLNVALHLANASPHPWLIPKDGFDEGVDLDSLLPMVQLVLLAVSVRLLISSRRTQRSEAVPTDHELTLDAG